MTIDVLPRHYLVASDFDQTLSFNDSGLVLSELIGASGFQEKVDGLARSNLVQQASAGNGDFVTPTVVGAGEYDYAARDLRYTKAMFDLLINDKEFADHNRQLMDQWLSTWVPRCITAVRELQPLWSQPDFKPPRFEDGLDRAKSRFGGILSELNLQEPKELTQ